MEQDIKEDAFSRHINVYTLQFISEEFESKFRDDMKKNMKLPRFVVLWTYFAVALHIGFRIICVIESFTNKLSLPHAPGTVEVCLLVYLLSMLLIEALIRHYKLWEKVHGFFIVIAFSGALITGGYTAQTRPVIGSMYYSYIYDFIETSLAYYLPKCYVLFS